MSFGISRGEYRRIEAEMKRAVERAREEGDEEEIEAAERELQRFYDDHS